MIEKLYRLSELIPHKDSSKKRILPMSRSTWYKGISEGRYPKPIRLGPRTSAWKESDIYKLINEGYEKT